MSIEAQLCRFRAPGRRRPLGGRASWLRRVVYAAVAPLAVAGVLVAPGQAQAASLTEVSNFGNNPSGLRMFWYVPDRLPANPGIIVMNHFCGGTAGAIFNDLGRSFVQAAEQNGYIAVFPQTTRSEGCFDVATPAGLRRGGGSDSTGIMSMVSHVRQRYSVDANRIVVAGWSSGAMMTHVLAAQYPDVFVAAAEFSGVPATCFSTGGNGLWNSDCAQGRITKSAQQWGDAARAMYPGYTGRYPRIQLWHGGTDDILSYVNFGEGIKQWTNLHRLGTSPTFTDSPTSGWQRTRYGSNGIRPPVEGMSYANAGHSLPLGGMFGHAVQFLGMDGSAPTTTTTTSRPPTTTTTTTSGGGAGTLATPGGKCLGVSGSGNGSSAQIQTCNGGPGQSWSFNSDGSLRTLGGSVCLDANAAGTANGTALIIWTCNGQANQRFSQGSNNSIVNAGSGRCVDVPNGSTTDGTGVQLYDCWGGDPQKWTYTGGGTPTTTTTTTRPTTTTTTTTVPPTTTTTNGPPPTTTTTTTTTSTTTTTTTGGSGPSCSATYTLVGSWGGGFQGEVAVRNTGGNITSWNVTMNLNSGQSITSLWSGVNTGTTGTVQVANAAYNGTLGSGASTTFGFTGGGNGTPVPTVTCAANGTGGGGNPTTTTTRAPDPVTTTTTTRPPTTTTTTTGSGQQLMSNNFPVTREGAYNNNRYTIFRPSTPTAVPFRMPVLAFGNGACAHTNNSEVTRLLTAIAAKGIVVIDIGSANGSSNGLTSGSPIPSLLTDAITLANNENNRAGSALNNRLDLTKVATAGHSCGGLEALIAGADARVKAVISLDSGLFADGAFGYSRNELNKLHSPVLFMDGGPSDIAYDNTRANYALVNHVPAIYTSHSQAGHGGFITGNQMNEAVEAVVNFLDMTLNNNQTARTYLLASSGLQSKQYWTVQRKGF